jgi:hypothetical protein
LESRIGKGERALDFSFSQDALGRLIFGGGR